MGGYIFKDPQSTQAWFQLLNDLDAHNFAPDFVSLLSLTADSVNTISEGLNAGANVIKEGYATQLGAESAMTFQIAYPEHILVPTKLESPNELGGFTWARGWSTQEAFVCM